MKPPLSANEFTILTLLWEEGRALSRPEIIELTPDRDWNPNLIHLILNNMIDKGVLKDIQDIYTIDYARTLSGTPGFGEKKIVSIVKAVEESKRQPFHRVLVSLGIPEIGKKAVELLVKDGLVSMDQLLELASKHDVDRLIGIKQMGPKTVKSLFDGLNDPANRVRIEALRAAGLQMEERMERNDVPQTMAGQVWCVTGSFVHFNPRSKAMEEVEKRGGRSVGSVSRKTTYLLVGTGGGSKEAVARSLGVKIVHEDEFIAMLGMGDEKAAGDQEKAQGTLF